MNTHSFLIAKINQVIDANSERLTIGEIFSVLVSIGEFENTRNNYQILRRHLANARMTGQVDGSRIAEGRWRKKFKVGDRVRIGRCNGQTPKWLREGLRLNVPRTVIAVINQRLPNGKVPTTHRTLYYLGSNKLGSGLVKDYGFRSNELILFEKGKVGRPRSKRRYSHNKGHDGLASMILPESAITPIATLACSGVI